MKKETKAQEKARIAEQKLKNPFHLFENEPKFQEATDEIKRISNELVTAMIKYSKVGAIDSDSVGAVYDYIDELIIKR